MKLIRYYLVEGGGMSGSCSSITISTTEDGDCKVENTRKLSHAEPLTHVSFSANGLLDKLSEACDHYGVSNWGNLPDLELEMRDGVTFTECFYFDDGTRITICSGKKNPAESRLLYKEFCDLISEAKSKADDLVITTDPQTKGIGFNIGGMGMMGEMNMSQAMIGGFTSVEPSSDSKQDAPKLVKFCSNCGTMFSGSQKFCAECGCPRGMKFQDYKSFSCCGKNRNFWNCRCIKKGNSIIKRSEEVIPNFP